jgi:hypothetical protein
MKAFGHEARCFPLGLSLLYKFPRAEVFGSQIIL